MTGRGQGGGGGGGGGRVVKKRREGHIKGKMYLRRLSVKIHTKSLEGISMETRRFKKHTVTSRETIDKTNRQRAWEKTGIIPMKL